MTQFVREERPVGGSSAGAEVGGREGGAATPELFTLRCQSWIERCRSLIKVFGPPSPGEGYTSMGVRMFIADDVKDADIVGELNDEEGLDAWRASFKGLQIDIGNNSPTIVESLAQRVQDVVARP